MRSASTTSVTGFIVHSFTRSIRGVSTICLIGRCDDHRTFAVLLTNVRPGFYIRKSDLPRARELAQVAEIEPDAQVRTIDGEPCARVSFTTDRDSQGGSALLKRAGVRTYEADIDTTDSLLMDHAIHGSLTITGVSQPGRHVDLVFLDPVLSSAAWQPELSILSLDIETGSEGEIFAIGLCFDAPWQHAPVREVLYSGMADFGVTGVAVEGNPFSARGFASERELLAAFFSRFSELDPDIITGWNVIDFDWQKLMQRSSLLGIRSTAGRSDEPALFLPADRRAPGTASRRATRDGEENEAHESGPFTTATMFIPGRQVIDGIRLLRYGPENFAAQSLDFVANAVLGMGKTIAAETGEEKIAEIERLRREDPEALCRYCLQDAVLVTRILDRTGLLKLTIARCLLIGVSLSRAWMSIRSFDFIYVEAMHRRGLVAPTLGVDALGMESAPGGAILTPVPGLFNWVMVFDFKSLYPSVIRTFNIDPVTLVRGAANGGDDSTEVVVAPNGASFSREPGILPELLDRFFRKREEAKRDGDPVASYVYKIIMNSFYGVLGAGGCRFAGTDLAGAITSLGQRVLRWCKKLLVEMGYTVIYGDTDSLFVLSRTGNAGGSAPISSGAVYAEAATLAKTINRKLSAFVSREYAVRSRLELEFEKVYERFFVPVLRSQAGGSDPDGHPARARGRAKGYAGLRAVLPDASGESPPPGDGLRERIEVKGMEAIRRDWTPLAQELQLWMLAELFRSFDPRASTLALASHIRGLIRELRSGRCDDKIIYSRNLRKSVSLYTRSQPPHVRAALLLPPAARRGLIRYVITLNGPQPVQRRTSPIDYDHYIERQLRPIVQTFAEATGPEVVEALTLERQLPLFGE